MLEALSAKFNVGVCHSRIACYMDISGDNIKIAAKHMQQAAWVFEDLKKTVSTLKPNETTPDFTTETLSALAALMLAQS
jgi:hypothetical protein